MRIFGFALLCFFSLSAQVSVIVSTVGALHVSTVRNTVSSTSATITWITDIPATTQLTYGLTPDYGTLTTETDIAVPVLNHSVSISGLSPCQVYYFRPISRAGGDIAAGSEGTIFTSGCSGLSPAVPSGCFPYDPGRQFHIRSLADISAVRTAAINDIWRVTHALPTRTPDTVTLATGTTYAYLTTTGMALSTIDKFGIDVEGGFHAELVLLHPTSSNNRLAIVHQGHCVPGGLANNLNDIKVKETITQLLSEGFYVLAAMQPGCGPNTPTAAGGDSAAAHNGYRTLESSSYNPLKIFLEPLAVALNYIAANYSFDNWSMTGISGGGWATTIYSAIDPRITLSMPVSGSMPHGLRGAGCMPLTPPEGDYEQGDQNSPVPLSFYLNIMSYEDAYLISSSEGRRQTQLIRASDPCCFGGPRYQAYETAINNLAGYLGGRGFKVYSDAVSNVHEISAAQRATIASELGF